MKTNRLRFSSSSEIFADIMQALSVKLNVGIRVILGESSPNSFTGGNVQTKLDDPDPVLWKLESTGTIRFQSNCSSKELGR